MCLQREKVWMTGNDTVLILPQRKFAFRSGIFSFQVLSAKGLSPAWSSWEVVGPRVRPSDGVEFFLCLLCCLGHVRWPHTPTMMSYQAVLPGSKAVRSLNLQKHHSNISFQVDSFWLYETLSQKTNLKVKEKNPQAPKARKRSFMDQRPRNSLHVWIFSSCVIFVKGYKYPFKEIMYLPFSESSLQYGNLWDSSQGAC